MGRPGGYAVDCNDDYAYITVEREGTEEEKERMMKNAFLPESNQPVKIKPTLCGIRKMNLSTGEVTKVIDTEFKTGHIQASRFTPGEIVFVTKPVAMPISVCGFARQMEQSLNLYIKKLR